MKRRRFLSLGAAAGATLVAGDAARAARPSSYARRPRASGDADIVEASIADLQRMMSSGAASAREIARAYLARVESIDRAGPELNAVIEVNPDALEIADALDAERAAGRVRGPMHGVPVLLKDNIDTGDRMLTTAGSLALVGEPAARDAELVRRLRAAGAVVLGKANLSEWANFRDSDSTSGWSGRGGQTRNPYDPARNPCGSSSGSAVAVAASLAAVAVGTETDGSVVCPAHACGVVGIKPTLGLVSRAGIVPIAHSQDTAGPMGRTVADAAMLLTAMAGADPRDPASARADEHATDYTRFLEPGAARGARIGIARQYFGFDERVDRVMGDVIAALRGAGAVIVDPVELATHGQFGDSEYEVLLYEFRHDLNEYLAGRTGVPVGSLQDVIAFNEAHADEELRWFGQDILIQSQAKGPLTDVAYRKAVRRAKQLAGPDGIDATMEEHRLDALLAPTGGPAWMIDLVNGDHFSGGSSSAAAVAGYPNVTVPAGYVHGLPVGVSLFGGAWQDGALIGLAAAVERELGARVRPELG